VRRQRDPSPASFGPELRQAREQLDLSLAVIQDRTGVHSRDLEALEEGDLSRFRDERAALVAVRRYADTVGLDGISMSQAMQEQWRSVADAPPPALTGATPRPTGITPATRGDMRDSASVPVGSTHLSRYPGDSSHLLAFTQTAQVPQVGRAPTPRPARPPGLSFDSTDAIPITPHHTHHDPGPASLGLRVAVWTLVLLLVVGVAGLSVDHWRPGWLAKIHLVTSGGTPATHPHHPGRSVTHTPIVTQTTSGPRSATVTVHSPTFQVVVHTQQPCWIQVIGPLGAAPVFSSTVPAGTTKIFTSANGKLSLELGASGVLVAVQVLGKTVPGWLLAPSAVPFVVNFRSAGS
jgi:hypothetical protein